MGKRGAACLKMALIDTFYTSTQGPSFVGHLETGEGVLGHLLEVGGTAFCNHRLERVQELPLGCKTFLVLWRERREVRQ